jgi:hypothetical protein
VGDDLGAADAAWPDEQLRAAATTDLEQALALGGAPTAPGAGVPAE